MELLRPGKTSKQGKDGHCCSLGRQQIRSSLRLTGAGNIKLLSILQLMISTRIYTGIAPLWGKGTSAVTEDNTRSEGMESVRHDKQGFCSSNLGPTPIPNRVVFATEQRREPGSYLALALDPPSPDVPPTKEIAASTPWRKI